MSELNKLAGSFIYKGCWEKKKEVIQEFKKVKKTKNKKRWNKFLFGFVDYFVLFFVCFSDFRILTLSDYLTWPKKNDCQIIHLSFVKS